MIRRSFQLLCSLLLALVLLPATAEELPSPGEAWIVVESDHFTFVSNAGRRRTAKVAVNLERFREMLMTYSKGMDFQSPLPTTIYIFKNESSFKPYSPERKEGDTQLAGYFVPSPDGNYVALDLSAGLRPYNVIYHEYLHYVLDNSIPDVPAWLNEGLAEFYSSFEVVGGKLKIGAPLQWHHWRLEGETLMPLTRLFAVDHRSPEYNEADRSSLFYAQSWALVHYLVAGDEKMRSRIPTLLRLIREGVDSAEAVETAYGVSLATLEEQLVTYVGEARYGMFTALPDGPFDEEKTRNRELEHPEVLSRLGDLLAHLYPAPFALAEAHLAASVAADPQRGESWVARAMLHWQADRLDEAEKFVRHALALADGDETRVDAITRGRAHAIYGQILLQRFSELAPGEIVRQVVEADTPPLILEARLQFQGGLEAFPDHIESLVGLGKSYALGDDDVAPGLRAMSRAVELNPARTELLADLVVLTARSGNTAAARTLLDRYLRNRGTEHEIAQGEAGLLQYGYERAEGHLEADRIDLALEGLRELQPDIRDPELRRSLKERIAMIERAQALGYGGTRAANGDDANEPSPGRVGSTEAPEGGNRYRDLYNEAVKLANAGDLEGAVERLEQVIADSGEPDLTLQARTAVLQMKKVLRHNTHVEQYNAAIDHANNGRFKEAQAVMEAILEDEPDADTRRMVERTLDEFREAFGGG